jgi:hypothetical protein
MIKIYATRLSGHPVLIDEQANCNQQNATIQFPNQFYVRMWNHLDEWKKAIVKLNQIQAANQTKSSSPFQKLYKQNKKLK